MGFRNFAKKMSNKIVSLFLTLGLLSIANCQQSSSNQNIAVLQVDEFEKKLHSTSEKIILDVRTAEEFANGHLAGAKNIDINSDKFDSEIKNLDTSQPIFVYCLAGSRSARAAEKLAQLGFSQIYDMQGGYSKWNGAAKPVQTANTLSADMNENQFNKITNNDTMVFIDVYAKWCAPCKKIIQYLPDVEKEFLGKIKVVKINFDANQQFLREKGIDNVPYLFLYKNGKELWKNSGFVEKEKLVEEIKKQL